ncbi:(2,3-dihydroxybenzoyl)adenylate synthase [Ruegeria sp. Ofav3-42]|uniref:(2,3-dihydroxybenzoyl)adenylate synthase n=1 Tax=Ruegeria sp. Ofav3-42 TaxID=2917759 RepID=UPI001EF6D09D|nr:AMP-binding protein [Ruegeria sp. Ofav3-42]MCG7521795.1 AMP-binding protein [Ruegeria sp. Ofav3-42]
MTVSAPDWQSLCPFWPDDVAQRYRAEGVWQDETFFGLLTAGKAQFGAKKALIDGDSTYRYDDLHDGALKLACGLYDLGLRRGDRVVLQLPNSIAFVELMFALFRLGVVPVLALPAHRDREIGQFADFVQARACIVPEHAGGNDMVAMAERVKAITPSVEHIIVLGDARDHVSLYDLRNRDGNPVAESGPWPMPDAEDVACFQISGGTTGVPKLIPRRHMEYLHNIRCATKASGMDQSSRYLCVLPIAHNFPLACPGVLGTLSVGGTAVMAPDPGAETCFALIDKHRINITSLVPPLAIMWIEAAFSRGPLYSLRVLQVGGAKLNPSNARQVAPRLGCKLQQVLGMAEGLICYTALDDDAERIHTTQGAPMSEWDEVRVVRGDGTEAKPGETGELQARGPYTIRGYYSMPEHNARAFSADGFYCTGDIVARDPHGYISVEGRKKDQVNRGGEMIGVDEIEDLLVGHPGVLDAAVVGRPDERVGERLCAFVIASPGRKLKSHELRRELGSAGIAGFKIPDEFIFVDAFPQTGVGKINKRSLRDLLKAQHFGEPQASKLEELAG